MSMASGTDDEQGEADHGRFKQGNQTDLLQEFGGNYASGDREDHHLLHAVDNSSRPVVDQSPSYCDSSCHARHAACLGQSSGKDDDDDYSIEPVHCWCKEARAVQTFLSQTSGSSLLCDNSGALVTNTSIACEQEHVRRAFSPAYGYPGFRTASATDLCCCDYQSLRAENSDIGCRSLAADGLAILGDDPQPSVLPLFDDLRQKISFLDNTDHEEYPTTLWQRRERPKGRSKPSEFSTWSDLSSSDELDDQRFHPKQGRGHAGCYGSRRLKLSGRSVDEWWESNCSEDPDSCNADMLFIDRHSSSRRRQKKSALEKNCSSIDDKLLNDVPLQLRSSLTDDQTTWHHDGASFTDCLADIESNATDSDDVGHVVSDDEDNDYNNTLINGDVSSSLVAPGICSFHCIPPDSGEKQAIRLTPSSIDDSPVGSPVLHRYSRYMSSEDEFPEALGNIHISDRDSCHSSCSFRGMLYRLFLCLKHDYFKVIIIQ